MIDRYIRIPVPERMRETEAICKLKKGLCVVQEEHLEKLYDTESEKKQNYHSEMISDLRSMVHQSEVISDE